MKIVLVIGDYGQLARALRNGGMETTLLPFSDYGRDFTSLSLLNETLRANYERYETKESKHDHQPQS